MGAENRYGLHEPHKTKQWLEKIGLRQITPSDITDNPDALGQEFPSLLGDQTAIGPGDDGGCPDWYDNPGWWRKFLDQQQHTNEKPQD